MERERVREGTRDLRIEISIDYNLPLVNLICSAKVVLEESQGRASLPALLNI